MSHQNSVATSYDNDYSKCSCRRGILVSKGQNFPQIECLLLTFLTRTTEMKTAKKPVPFIFSYDLCNSKKSRLLNAISAVSYKDSTVVNLLFVFFNPR